MARTEPVYVAGAYEHPTREAPDTSTMQLHAEVAAGALRDAGLPKDAVDGYCTAGVPEYSYAKTPLVMADYLGLDVAFADSTEFGGSSYLAHVGHAANAIRNGVCDVVLVTLAGRPRSRSQDTGTGVREMITVQDSFERIYGEMGVTNYAMAARRHMHEYGTTSEQLAAIREAASYHAQYNEHALYRDPVTVEDVLESRPIADPLHLLDCCVISDGGGAVVVVSEDVREELDRECVSVLGYGEAIGGTRAGRVDVTESAARLSGERAFADAGVSRDEIDYVSLYDSFTITVLMALEDLGFCEKGEGGSFVEGDTLKAPDGELPFNTDGGGLSSNHPGNRGGMTKIIEAVRQLRGEANDEVQVEDATLALAHGTGGRISTRHGCGTLILGREDR
ncbi:thiolase domain-containing protein [Natrarchaeobius oligotrophus]|uniref:Thiolase domain-containing protein n=1 Tax=Natrarchaeobius chitinivorans TaxID=1679083 RepID=A0A3N6N4B7_NATCH|nr:thiolase domain-containing protein [Natrarchaeobius chitinivorans]RQH02587.1 thiolase domain-containing protein [Natrarchaeobius chitinivorans]